MLTKWNTIRRYFEQYVHAKRQYMHWVDSDAIDLAHEYMNEVAEIGDQIWANMRPEYIQYMRIDEISALHDIYTEYMQSIDNTINIVSKYASMSDIRLVAEKRKKVTQEYWSEIQAEITVVKNGKK